MKEFQVTCVTRDKGARIIGIGGASGWRLTEAEVIRRLEMVPHEEAFYTGSEATRDKAYIGVFRSGGMANLRTYRDKEWNNNLEALPDCP
jgi:hypothetical protein